MRALPRTGLVAAPLFALIALGCQASIDAPPPGAGAGGSGAGGAQNLAGSATLPPGTETPSLLPARIRRLTDSEYQTTVSSVVGDAASGISADFVPDSRQGGFTVNEAQRVDPVLARQLADAALKLAADVRAKATPCAASSTPAQCADAFIRDFGKKAYRRPLADDEVQQLMTVFNVGLEGGSYAEGIELATRAMLQSAAFLYHTEIGEAPAATVKLTPYELASSISYLLLGGPPSDKLVEKALTGELDTTEGRAALVAEGLFQDGAGYSPALPSARVRRVIQEWLGTDRILLTAKDSNVYPRFEGLRPQIEAETASFLGKLVQDQKGGSVATLLSADWTVAQPQLLNEYGATSSDGSGFASTPKRLGLLNQAAFLSVFAHAHETAPVLRGVAIMRRVACIPVPDPVDLSAAIVPPPPDPNKTTRDRFSAHATTACAACHDRIDNFGFAFEGFDGMGMARTVDNNQPVNSNVTVAGTDFDGTFADSNELVKAMAQSPQVHECFARNMFRALAGTSSAASRMSEDGFVEYWKSELATVTESSIAGTLSSYVTSPSFNFRRGQ
jgi:Protein of unknown function (DUF1588)/Protein of unknown function (DUF1595)/Protein of unknown function (DUF1592)/Protein of unknown function (DUF1587)